MLTKIILLFISFSFWMPNESKGQDSLPPLNTIKETDIDQITSSFEKSTITVKLKSGLIYTYSSMQWDFEDYNPSTCQKVREEIKRVARIFTKVEHPPVFPGREEGWAKYISNFCLQNEKAIGKHGSGQFLIGFIVHLHGQVCEVHTINGEDSKISRLALQAIQMGPPWIPATQNGYTVVSYQTQMVKLGR
jgi:hypothetical protein